MRNRRGWVERWTRKIPHTILATIAMLIVFGMLPAAASACTTLGSETITAGNDLRGNPTLGPDHPEIPDTCYIVPTYINIKYGQTLTVQAGVVLKFDPGADITVTRGALIADGTPADPIRFTSNKEPAQPGDWRGLSFYERTSSQTILDNCIVEYGDTLVSVNLTSFTIRNSEFWHSKYYGLFLSWGVTADMIVEQNLFVNNPIAIWTASNESAINGRAGGCNRFDDSNLCDLEFHGSNTLNAPV